MLELTRKTTPWQLVILAVGIASPLVQLVVTRELLGAFAGNEYVVGVSLGLWLLFTGLGSTIARSQHLSDYPSSARIAFAVAGLGVLAPTSLLILRGIRLTLMVRGAQAGPTEALLAAPASMLPYCMLSGFLLCRASTVLAAKRGPAEGLGHGYMLDAAGSVLGGVLFSFVLVHFLTHGAIVVGTGLLLLGTAVTCQLLDGQRHRASLVVVATIFVYFIAAAAERRTLNALALGQPVQLNANTPYGHLLATKVGEQYNFFLNGVPYFSTGQHDTAEERVHLAMLQRPNAERVLLLSAPIPEIIAELLRYPRLQVDCVYPDQRLIRQIEKVAPHVLSDPRVHLISADPRFYVRACAPKYDVIFLFSPLPDTLQFHRLYTVEFFREVRAALRQGGVLAFPFGDFTGYLSPEQARAIATCYNTLSAAFRNVLILPAAQIYYVASDGSLSSDYATLYRQAQIITAYVGPSYFETMITADRLATLEAAAKVPASINLDFQPKLLSFTLRRWLDEHGYKVGALEVAITLLIFAYAVSLRGPAVAVFASGFSAAGLEYLLLFLLQVLAGALYYQVGIVVTAFMVGLVAGAWMGAKVRVATMSLVWNQLLTAGIALALVALLPPMPTITRSIVNPIAPLLSVTIVVLGLATLVGYAFPAAARAERFHSGTTPARLYTADFIGAAAGAILLSTLLVPTFGVGIATLCCAAVNIWGAIAMWRARSAVSGIHEGATRGSLEAAKESQAE